MSNELTLFEQKSLETMQKLSSLKQQIDELNKIDASLRDKLQEYMTEYGITSFKNDYVTISNVAPSESVSIDLKALETAEPECYSGLLADYPKVTKRKGYVKITIR